MLYSDGSYAGSAFFLGANTPGGFYSLFSQLYAPEEGWRLLILKGGPGTGKSSLLKKIAAAAAARGLYCERIYCSSDPDSLDAVIIPGLKFSAADGTAPHVLEPKYPGVSETLLDLGRFRDDATLRERADDIIALTQANAAAHRECAAFLKAAGSVENEISAIAAGALEPAKLKNFAYRFAESACGAASPGKGVVKKRFLSACTPQGVTVFYESVAACAERLIVLRDDFGLAASKILSVLSETAAAAGYEVVECRCPMQPDVKTEHVFLPALSLAVCTSNAFHPFAGGAEKTVNCQKFFRPEELRRHKNRLAFDRRAQRELLDAALNKLKEAKRLHDELERCYVRAMDFGALNAYADALSPKLIN